MSNIKNNGASTPATSVPTSLLIESIQQPLPLTALSGKTDSQTFVSSSKNQTKVSSVASNAQFLLQNTTIKPAMPVVSISGHPSLPQQLVQPNLLSARYIYKPISFQPNSSQSSLINVQNVNRYNNIQQNVPRPRLVLQNQTSRPSLMDMVDQNQIGSSMGLVPNQFSRPPLSLTQNTPRSSGLSHFQLVRPTLFLAQNTPRSSSLSQVQVVRPPLLVAQNTPRSLLQNRLLRPPLRVAQNTPTNSSLIQNQLSRPPLNLSQNTIRNSSVNQNPLLRPLSSVDQHMPRFFSTLLAEKQNNVHNSPGTYFLLR